MNDFIKAITGSTEAKPITAYFKNGKSGDYTIDIFELLKTDPDILTIVDGTTGEIIFSK